jgi:hypothetical protein
LSRINEHLISEFLDEINERADNKFNGRAHQAFIDWYIEAEFGGDTRWTFTDDVNDGGIDAVIWRPDEVPPLVIIQSKYTERVGNLKLGARVYQDFKTVIRAFRYGEDEFDEFLSGVRNDLRQTYRRAFESLNKLGSWHQKKKAFRLVATSARRRKAEFDDIPEESFVDSTDVLRLYNHYRQAQTPKARVLRLRIDDKLSYRDAKRGIESYTFNARLHDFRKYLQHNDVSRLVARNIRYDLGGRIARNIRKTYEKTPGDFWYFHNGLTLICDDCEEKQGEAIITGPSVINGAQTLYAISTSSAKPSSALVATRVIVRGTNKKSAWEDDDWIQDVIESVNSQNKVQAYDLRSNDAEQILLQARFRELKVYYERKRGEWREVRNEPKYRSFDRLSLKMLGQILSAVSEEDGDGVLRVKKGTSEVFHPDNYKKLFGNKARVARQFPRTYLDYRLFQLLRARGYANSKEFRKQRHAFWNCLWLLSIGVAPAIRLKGLAMPSLKKACDQLDSARSGKRIAKQALRKLTRSVWRMWRKARKADPEGLTANNFFKSKAGMRMLSRRVTPQVSTALRSLGKHINSQL